MTGASRRHKRDDRPEKLPFQLREQLAKEIDLRYISNQGSRRSSMNWAKIETDWNDCPQTIGYFPSAPTIRNIINLNKEKKTSEYRVINGLCHLLLDCSYDSWMEQWQEQSLPTETVNPDRNEPDREQDSAENSPRFSSDPQFSIKEDVDPEDADPSMPPSSPLVESRIPNWHNFRGTNIDIPTPSRSQPWRNSIARIAVTFLIALTSSYFAFGSQLAIWANQLGKGYHLQDQYLVAKFFYRTAALLNPKQGAYHYNVGWMCDEIANRDCAIEEFQKASLRGFPDAYAELGRLYLLDGEQPEAFRATQKCLQQAVRDGEQAACWKNLGWLRVQKQQWEEAETALRKAIDLNPDSAHTNCLLAQVLEAHGKLQDALPFWIETLKYIKPDIPEHDECQQLAKQRLQQVKIKR